MGAGRRIERILLEIEPNAIQESAAGPGEQTGRMRTRMGAEETGYAGGVRSMVV